MAMSAPVAARPLTVDEVIKMSEAGILAEGERVELRDGLLTRMSPESNDHAEAVERLTMLLADRYYRSGYSIRVQITLSIDEINYLVPDFVVRGRPLRGWPAPDQVELVVELARSSVRYDIGQKALDYAAWGAQRYWVVDLARGEVVVHENPIANRYRSITRIGQDGHLTVPGVGSRLAVRDLVPPWDD